MYWELTLNDKRLYAIELLVYMQLIQNITVAIFRKIWMTSALPGTRIG